jgi:glycogen phosphorylase
MPPEPSTSVEALKESILHNLELGLATTPTHATVREWYLAVAMTVRGLLVANSYRDSDGEPASQERVVALLSAEYLLGPHLHNNLVELNIYDEIQRAVASLGQDLSDLIAQEPEPGLGNGGLGRLAACYMESLATLKTPAIGYGIRYEFGIFEQQILDGWQVERSDEWLRHGNPWEIARPSIFYRIRLGGRVETELDESGVPRSLWIPDRIVRGVAYDTFTPGYRVPWVNLLRLWKAESHQPFDFQRFNVGNYVGAVEEQVLSENITRVLYPNDEQLTGKVLRLEQEYFFVSCSLQDMIRLHRLRNRSMSEFHRNWAVQLNDTHPAIAVAELMRILIDDYRFEWSAAWEVTRQTFAYTNHTLLPEALERWPLSVFGALLPRHLEIIYEINERMLREVRARFPGDAERVARMSIIEESGEKHVRMAHLATVGSHRINGVAKLHSELLTRGVLRDFAEMYPEKFTNVTNGVTPRRWIAVSNPDLTALISSRLRNGWLAHMETELRQFEQYADDPEMRDAARRVKTANKRRLAAVIEATTGDRLDPDSIFDVQVKRIHEYKRQHLNVLHVLALYNRLRRDPGLDLYPRTFIFGGKAAPGYAMAKLIIKLINSVGQMVNRDPAVAGRLHVVFVPNFNIRASQQICPAADLSEQISTAGKEASGTGNMKFAMNGAVTIGTLDGANIEIREQVGAENFFLFGLTAPQAQWLLDSSYRPRDYYERNPELAEAIDLIDSGRLPRSDRETFRPLVDSLLARDPFLALADFESYVNCQAEVEKAYRDRERWARMSILNIARSGHFSSDRAINEYRERIWRV